MSYKLLSGKWHNLVCLCKWLTLYRHIFIIAQALIKLHGAMDPR